MTTSHAQPTAIRTGPLMAQIVAACSLGGLMAIGVGHAAKWAGGDTQTIAVASLTPMILWAVAGVIGVMLLGVLTHNQPARLAIGVLASSTARMLIALLVGVLLFFLMSLEGRCFWTSFLLAGLFALVAETTWAIRTINASRPGTPTGVR
ncbi:MAG TPA: hypothetical protein VD997_16040 [Phycisphaerales bacterium]|nr:hypothetical protein [Phycisphaerales bacterium]